LFSLHIKSLINPKSFGATFGIGEGTCPHLHPSDYAPDLNFTVFGIKSRILPYN